MAAESILGGISQEATQQELLGNVVLLLSMMLEKMPRIDANDRVHVTTDNAPGISLTNSTLLRIDNMGASSRVLDATPMHLSNAGAMHLYDNIKFS